MVPPGRPFGPSRRIRSPIGVGGDAELAGDWGRPRDASGAALSAGAGALADQLLGEGGSNERLETHVMADAEPFECPGDPARYPGGELNQVLLVVGGWFHAFYRLRSGARSVKRSEAGGGCLEEMRDAVDQGVRQKLPIG